MTLVEAPGAVKLKIVEIAGGESTRRRLMSLGFHEGDRIEAASRGILGGPILVKNLDAGISVALGRGVASKIKVDVVDERAQ